MADLTIRRPIKWIITIEKCEDGWHEDYTELFSPDVITDGEIENTIDILKPVLEIGCKSLEVTKVEQDSMIGANIKQTTDLTEIATQIIGEFIGMSKFGEITMLDLFTVGALALKERIKTKTIEGDEVFNGHR